MKSLYMWVTILALLGTLLAFLLFSAFFHPLTATRRRAAASVMKARPRDPRANKATERT